MYDKSKDQEQLSTLLAIKYLKSNMALDISLKDEGEKSFKEAEKLRKNYNGRKRSDVYESITRYYYKQGEYEKAKEYGLETIDINKDIKQYQLDSVSIIILLGQTYLELGEIDKALEIASVLEDIEIDENDILKDKLILYADIYEYHSNEKESINNLKKAYILSKENSDFLEQDKILNKIISLTKETQDGDLLYLYEEYLNLHNNQLELKNNQFLISKIIDADVINAKADLKIVELENRNLRYVELILILIVAIIIFFIRRLIYLNRHDGLTNIYNRGYFNRLYKNYNDKKERYSLVIFDIDNFKKLNDTYGHDFGDVVLVNISKSIKNMLNKDCKLFRYGGEEFVVLIKNEDIDYALKIAEEIRQRVAVMTWREDTTVTISIGLSYSLDSNDDMIKRADNNLYESKINGKIELLINNIYYTK